MGDTTVTLWFGGAKFEYPRVREVVKAGTHQLIFVNFQGVRITTNLQYSIFEEPGNRLMS
jgi:hypothetical protein